jgi:TonB family protein
LNRMLSPITAFRRRAAAFPFLMAFVLAGANVPSAAKAASPEQVSELATEAAAKLLIHVEKPDYPSIARVNFIRGIVRLKIKVTSKGRVSEVHVLQGEPILAVAAFESVRKWLYRPYVSKGGPVPFSTYVAVNFKLHPHAYKGQFPKGADDYLGKQVRPPEVVSQPQQEPSSIGIRMKVLVGSKGEMVDATSIKAAEPEIDLARKNLLSWKFRPAKWGAIAVPWYVTVTVPLPYVALDQTANSAKH